MTALSADLWSDARRSVARLEQGGLSGRSLMGYGALGLSIALVIFATLVLGANVARLRQSFAWVQHTNDVLRHIGNVRENLLRVEADMRAYVLSGEDAFLADYRPARAALLGDLDRVRTLVADNPAEVANVAALRPVVVARLRHLDEAGSWGPASLSHAIAASRDEARSAARRRMDAAIAGRIATMREAELTLLSARQNDAERKTRGALGLALLAAAFAVVSGALGAVVVSRERARRRAGALELELMHKQRELMMDQASAHLAHEINQPLTAATNYLGAASRMAANVAVPRLGETLQKAGAQINRAGEIVRRLRRFVDRQVSEQRLEQPDALIAEAVALLGTIDPSVRVAVEVPSGLPGVMADGVQIQQVLVNLMRNAIEAMQASERRELVVGALLGKDGEMIFSLADSGPGVSAELARRLFKPVASAKRSGMGVGLSICHTIIVAHGGRIWVEPGATGGATFRFTLPAWRAQDAVAAA